MQLLRREGGEVGAALAEDVEDRYVHVLALPERAVVHVGADLHLARSGGGDPTQIAELAVIAPEDAQVLEGAQIGRLLDDDLGKMQLLEVRHQGQKAQVVARRSNLRAVLMPVPVGVLVFPVPVLARELVQHVGPARAAEALALVLRGEVAEVLADDRDAAHLRELFLGDARGDGQRLRGRLRGRDNGDGRLLRHFGRLLLLPQEQAHNGDQHERRSR